MSDIIIDKIKEEFKKILADKSKEELLDIAAGFCVDIMWLNFTTTMTDANTQVITQRAKEAIMDAINGNCKEIVEIVKNSINTSTSPLTAKIREGGI